MRGELIQLPQLNLKMTRMAEILHKLEEDKTLKADVKLD